MGTKRKQADLGDERNNISPSPMFNEDSACADDAILSTNSEVNVVFTFLVYDYLRDKYLAVQDGKIRRFHAPKTEWGFEKLISLDNFSNPSNGFLVDDCCAFGVDIIVMKCDGKGERATIGGWLYPKGCPKATTDFLSLYLGLDSLKDLPKGSQVYIEWEMSVLSQFGVGHNKKTAHNRWLSSGGEYEDSWGVPRFMSLSDLMEPTKGFIYNDTLIVEAKINVVSTLKEF
ncbi:uncharacterized protein LOC111015606 [Momordica charantia]|uniref:Uncharacterized protein LOC111015606 n=1 Tax=Momordica charantia TaxID=3673 RepID=A0A6J1CZF3_MOMCH|nr:uncharacterized protein LOC111015606 [Momordica charantia]